MNPILRSVLLVDDDDATNFLHKKIIRENNFAKQCHVVETGEEALEFLTTKVEEQYPQPDLIFLDINMPIMNGWCFLEKYASLKKEQKANVVLVMLTTSLNPDDELKGNAIDDVASFMKKPLTKSMLDRIIKEHFLELA